MSIRLVEPDLKDPLKARHVFECQECGLSRAYLIDRGRAMAGAGVLSACATEKTDTARLARLEYDLSVADYQNCIAANQMSTCEAERRIIEANKRVLQRRRPSY